MGLLDNGGYWQGGQKIGGRDVLAGLLAAVGDALAQQNGGEAIGMKGLLETRLGAREEAMKAQAAQAKRGQEWEDWVKREQWKRDNPDAPDPTGTTRLIQESANWTEDEWKRFGRLNPVKGDDGWYYPRAVTGNTDIGETLPPGWKIDGGGTGNGVVTFP